MRFQCLNGHHIRQIFNRIEYAWAMPKKMLLERYPRLIEIGKIAQAIEQFKEAIREY
jgi:hypothetical protein